MNKAMTETELAEIKCITLTGENVVIAAAHFDALLSTVRELQRQNDELTNVVGMCRAAAGWGTDADPMNVQSWAAMGDPAEVPDFIRDQFRELQRQVQEREADARRYRWLRDWAQSYQMHEWFKSGLSLQQIDAAIDKAIATNKHLSAPKEQTP